MEIDNNASNNASFIKRNPLPQVDKSKLKDDFLTLLMAQMKYKDPLEPADNLGFTEQLATFATMEQVAGINEKLDYLMKEKVNNSSNVLENINLLSSYINCDIEAQSETINIQNGFGTAFYELKEPAAKVKIEIKNKDEVIYSEEISAQKNGFHNFVIKGEDEIKNGNYSFHVIANDSKGNPIKVGNILKDKVDGINIAVENTPLLTVGNLNVDPKNITRLRKI